MKTITTAAMVLALLAAPAAQAQPRDHGDRQDARQHGYQHEREVVRRDGRRHADNGRHRGWGTDRGTDYRWSRGDRMGYNDWRQAERVDYRRYKLRRPPAGYEWRRRNDQFILVAATTGLIASIIMNAGR